MSFDVEQALGSKGEAILDLPAVTQAQHCAIDIGWSLAKGRLQVVTYGDYRKSWPQIIIIDAPN